MENQVRLKIKRGPGLKSSPFYNPISYEKPMQIYLKKIKANIIFFNLFFCAVRLIFVPEAEIFHQSKYQQSYILAYKAVYPVALNWKKREVFN